MVSSIGIAFWLNAKILPGARIRTSLVSSDCPTLFSMVTTSQSRPDSSTNQFFGLLTCSLKSPITFICFFGSSDCLSPHVISKPTLTGINRKYNFALPLAFQGLGPLSDNDKSIERTFKRPTITAMPASILNMNINGSNWNKASKPAYPMIPNLSHPIFMSRRAPIWNELEVTAKYVSSPTLRTS